MVQSADLVVIGGGLAGCEAAWQAAERGLKVDLFEMRPAVQTGAHTSSYLAELVCSNSLGSNLPDRASGLLKEELRRLHSMLLRCAEESAVPAGGALAVDRDSFTSRVTAEIHGHPNIRIIREESRSIPDGLVVIASGPLTSPALSSSIQELTGQDHLFFYDAIAPIISVESIDMQVAFRGSRYERGDQPNGDYINCPLTEQEYDAFVSELRCADRIMLNSFEHELEEGVRAGADQYFEGCLPVEILASRSDKALMFGPLRPIGLYNPSNGRRYKAVVQLRQDNLAGTLYNMVGFQTNLTFSEQRRIFRTIPGLQRAEFVRYGQMHRNTFIFSPGCLHATLQFKSRLELFFAGQITGVEGYIGNIATGWLAGCNAARLLWGKPPLELPPTTMLGALCYYITHASAEDFQPMKANFGILPELESSVHGKRPRAAAFSARAISDLEKYLRDRRI